MLTDISASLEFSKKENIFTELKKHIWTSTKILVAVSTGMDSMFVSAVLYKFFNEEKLPLDNLYFLHLNHGVRDASEKEVLFVKKFFGEKVFVIYRNAGDTSDNSEERMRFWRYKQFDTMCVEKNIDFVVTGHHLNDRVESSFLHLLRGAGLQWFLSMQFCEHHHLLSSAKILRPLLSLNKGEILALVEKHKIPYMQDESNFDPDISKRNKLRNVVLPQLFELAHKYTDTENSFLESMQNVYRSMDAKKNKEEEILTCDLKTIEMSPYWNAEWAYRMECLVDSLETDSLLDLLKYLDVAQNVTKKNLSEIVNFLNNKKSGHKFFNGVTFFVAHGEKYLMKAKRGFWKTSPWSCQTIFLNPFLDKSGKRPENATIRYPKKWDRYKGRTRNQFCVRQKIPVFWRNFVPVIEVDGEIVGYVWEGDFFWQ